MKIRSVFLFGIIFFLFFIATSWGAIWKFYAMTWQGTNYYDAATLKWLSKNIIKVSVKNVPSPDGKEWVIKKYSDSELGKLYDKVSYDINLFEINCANQTMRISEGTSYDHSGTPIMTGSEATDWYPIVPGGTTDSLAKVICKKKKASADWLPAGDSEFDASRITRISPAVVRVWERAVFSEDVLDELRKDQTHDYSDYSHTINRKRINCKKRTIGGAGSTDYNSRGGVIQYFDETNVKSKDIQMLPVASCSYGESFIQTVCYYVNKVSKKEK